MRHILLRDSISNSLSSLEAKTTGTDDTPSILTPIPAGQRWRLKAVHGEAVELLPPIFVNRLEALIAAARLAEHCGARVVP